MKYILFVTLLGQLFGCSYSIKQSESIDDKIARFNPKVSPINEVPEITTTGFTLNKVQTTNVGRAPASVPATAPKESVSIKRLYFNTLFDQYLKLSKFSSTQPVQLNHCPSFHTSFVSLKYTPHIVIKKIPDSIAKPIAAINEQTLALYPELSLPVTIDSIYPKVGDLWLKINRPSDKQIALQNAIDLHVQKNYLELNELCQTGASSNYYSFENLMTFLNNTTPKSESDSLKLLFKTTLFTNELLIKSLSNFEKPFIRAPSSIHKEADFITVTQMNWIQDYFESLRKLRYPAH